MRPGKNYKAGDGKKWHKKEKEQLNAVIARKVRSHVKKHFKRCGITYQSSRDDSSDKSDSE